MKFTPPRKIARLSNLKRIQSNKTTQSERGSSTDLRALEVVEEPLLEDEPAGAPRLDRELALLLEVSLLVRVLHRHLPRAPAVLQ
jgi:hypothetical protein